MKVKLTKENIDDFLLKTLSYDEAIYLNDKYNAKSLFSLMNLNLPQEFNVEIKASFDYVKTKFERDMEEFKA